MSFIDKITINSFFCSINQHRSQTNFNERRQNKNTLNFLYINAISLRNKLDDNLINTYRSIMHTIEKQDSQMKKINFMNSEDIILTKTTES